MIVSPASLKWWLVLRTEAMNETTGLDPTAEGRHRTQQATSLERLSEPLRLLAVALQSVDAAKDLFPNYRLTRLVGARLDLDMDDIAEISTILGEDVMWEESGVLRPFEHHLRHVIGDYGLWPLFSDDRFTPGHHAIRPTGYDFYLDQVVPAEMEKWRAIYRAMSDERQMLAASIIWLYRGGKDNVWLRRVACTWHAADAVAHMKTSGVLRDWARLYGLYPGW